MRAHLCNRVTYAPPRARSDVNLWPEDLPRRTLVVLSANDLLIHVPEVPDGGGGGAGGGSTRA